MDGPWALLPLALGAIIIAVGFLIRRRGGSTRAFTIAVLVGALTVVAGASIALALSHLT